MCTPTRKDPSRNESKAPDCSRRKIGRGRLLLLALLAVSSLAAATLVAAILVTPAPTEQPLVVHEWGTFTALQNEEGDELSGINTDDEPVPDFVHKLAPGVVQNGIFPGKLFKGFQGTPPLFTIRLETPVIYFYPPEGQQQPLMLDVDVQFKGGWLSEFYPHAEAHAPGLYNADSKGRRITPNTLGTLSWKNLQVGTSGQGPATDEHVWLAPRKVKAAAVTTPAGESEKYLFYRGVGNFKAPLRVATDRHTGRLTVRANFGQVLRPGQSSQIKAAWLLHVRPDGSSAFREMPSFRVTDNPQQAVASLSSRFEDSQYAQDTLKRLRGRMHAALVSDGLFADEATAMLSIWQRSYFQSPGLRLFYLVPRQWTDTYLPLNFSVPTRLQRVMVGRMELISSEQRQLLEELAAGPVSNGQWTAQVTDPKALARILTGQGSFDELGVEVPPDYRKYLKLGRFCNALVLAEHRRRPTPSLTKFITTYGLGDVRAVNDGGE